MSAPCTHFRDRAALVANALSYVGLVPEAAGAMTAADDKITTRLEDLDAKVAEPTAEDLAAAGVKWATGKNKTASELVALLAVPHAPARYAVARKAAQESLVAAADKAHPEWSTAALIDSTRQAVAEWLESLATEATESLADLPAKGREFMGQPYGSAAHLDGLVDGATTPVEHISAYRRATAAWAHLDDGGSLTNNAYVLPQREALAVAMAHGRALDPFTLEPARLDLMSSHPRVLSALWLDADGMAAHSLGLGMSQVVYRGLGRLVPLVDPLGEDAEELSARLAAADASTTWLAGRLAENSPRVFGSHPVEAHEYATHGRDRLGKAGFQNSLDAALALQATR